MNYSKLVPSNSFIGRYMAYMNGQETPEAYDFWCALWCIGTVCGRDVFVDRPRSRVHLNWYVILAAESGTTRKSSAVRVVGDILNQLNLTPVSAKTSPESLEAQLAEQTTYTGSCQVSFVVPELVTLLGKEGYLAAMPGLLTDLYDCPETRIGSTRVGRVEIRNAFVSFLSASTPSWLVTAINPSVIEGGFTSRVIFVVENTRKRHIAWPEKPDEQLFMEMCNEPQRSYYRYS